VKYSSPLLCSDELDDLSVMLKAMSHPTRLWILQFLYQQKCCFSGEIAEELPIARSTVSEHLRQLKEAGLIQGEIEHPKIRYCLNVSNWKRLEAMMGVMFDGFSEETLPTSCKIENNKK
jgi:ArsR family transcriptional regulator, arsenate/arsenite/antimonite-responsive transcriptional repressor